jgi:tRNA-dihydrouridine synthase
MKLWLAPMEGITDCVFRTKCYNYGADLTFTEMVRIDALIRGNKATHTLLEWDPTPTALQILGVKMNSVQEFVKQFPSYNITPVHININASCPSPEVIRIGAGAALMKRTQRLNDMISRLRKLDLPVTVKMRLGLNEFEKKNKVYLNTLKAVDADAFIIHAKHARQESRECSDWSIYEECIATGKHIVANGDISTKEHVNYFKKLGLKEIMIGRAAIKNPEIFRELKS